MEASEKFVCMCIDDNVEAADRDADKAEVGEMEALGFEWGIDNGIEEDFEKVNEGIGAVFARGAVDENEVVEGAVIAIVCQESTEEGATERLL